jgi:glutathione synthase/RimK-type ligase-like ATP-grasp enzyme
MRRIAFATMSAFPDLHPDDLLLAGALRGLGIATVTPVVWDAAEPGPESLAGFDAVVIRSTWDRRLTDFLAWVQKAEAAGARIFNSPRLIRWNSRKSYLAELCARGVRIVPTFEPAREASAAEITARACAEGWTELIVKPAVSAGAEGAGRVAAGDVAAVDRALRSARAHNSEEGILIQPYLREVETGGELSLLFFGGVFSHAVIKRPGPGDFRVQEHLGGSTEPATVSSESIAEAREIIARAPELPLYARVDVIPSAGGHLLLGELELIEPFLFLGYDAEAPVRLASVIAEWVHRACAR